MTAFAHDIPGYELIRELGVGGMATVYLAIQRSLDRKVAIKVMKRNIDDLEKFERRFLMEGRTMAKLPHRNIVAVYDIVKGEEISYIAMEFLEAGTLSAKMKEGLSLAEAISVVVQIGQALQFAHEHGIVHRDLKPANIMFRDAHTPVLTDFGIAKQQDASATRLTQTGMLVGTPTYMSPEQINAVEVDGRSDLYSLGVMFYELLTGAPPFSADTPIAVLMAHLTTPPPPLPPHFADFQPVLDRMLAKNRDDRFPSLKDFTRALKAAVVNNQNLLARLQSDPNASSSEQLRALGFSGGDSLQFGTTGPQMRLPPSGKGTPRTPTPTPTPLPMGVQGGPMPGGGTGEFQRPGPPWKWIGIGGGLLAALVVAAVLLWPKGSEIDETTKRLLGPTLAQIDASIASGELDKALESIAVATTAAPDYPPVRERVDKLVAAFKAQAGEAMQKGDLETATLRVGQAKALAEGDIGLAEIEQRILAMRQSAAAAKEVADLLARADQATQQGRDLAAGGAYALLMEARAKAPQDAQVKQRLDALLERALKPARDALGRGDVAGARTALDRSRAALANEAAFQSLTAEVERANAAQAARAQLAAVLQAFDRQVAAGRLIQPQGDSAQTTLARAMALAPKDPEVLRRQDVLANALTAQAQRAVDAGQFEQALALANDALNVKPDFAAAAAVKRGAEGRLDATRVRIAEGLASAREAVAAQKFLSPPGRNARELLENVLRLDAANAEARAQLAALPRQIADAARARAQGGDVAGAATLVDEGRRAYAQDPALAALANQLAQQLAQARALAERGKTFDRISQLLAARPLRAEAVGEAAQAIAGLTRANPGDLDAATARQRLVETLDAALGEADRPAALEAVNAAITQARAALPGDNAIAALSTRLAETRTRLEAEEQARIAASAGELVINAYPWATVASVVDADRKPVTLPADASTPLRLKVPAGVYTVTFRHPGSPRALTQVARVEARKSAAATQSFASTVSARAYLQRAGY